MACWSNSGTGVGLISHGRTSPGSTRRTIWLAAMRVLPLVMLSVMRLLPSFGLTFFATSSVKLCFVSGSIPA